MSWIQGGRGGYWWRLPNWEGDDWMMKLDEYGQLVLMIKKGVPARRTLEDAGFLGVKIKATDEEARLEGYVVYHVTVNDLVPAPKYAKGESSIYPGFDSVVIDFRVKLSEKEARELWVKGNVLDLLIKRFFGSRGNAKRKLRVAFRIKEKKPDRQPALTSGSVWIDRKGMVR